MQYYYSNLWTVVEHTWGFIELINVVKTTRLDFKEFRLLANTPINMIRVLELPSHFQRPFQVPIMIGYKPEGRVNHSKCFPCGINVAINEN
jgi:hypothetical protein